VPRTSLAIPFFPFFRRSICAGIPRSGTKVPSPDI